MSLPSILIGLGGPLLAKMIGDKLGPAAGTFAQGALDALGKALGTEPTPEAIQGKIEEMPPQEASVVVQQVETHMLEQLQVIAGDLADYRQLLRTDAASEGFLARNWRPILAIVFTLSGFALLPIVIARAIWMGDGAILNAVADLASFLIFYYSAGCAVLGVYVWGRTKEKAEGATP